MTELEIKYFETSCKLTEDLYQYLQENTSHSLKMDYIQSYASQMRYSKLNEPQIRIKVKGYNTCICISAYMCGERPRPYALRLWKYNGEHYFYDEDMSEKEAKDYKHILDKINEFYGFISNTPRYEQLTLF